MLLMTCTQVTMYFSPTRKPVPAGSPPMCISPTLLLTFVFTSLDITSFCLWVPFEKGWVQANLVVTGFAFWKKKMNIFLSIWLFSCTVLVLYNFSIQFQFTECMEYFCRIYLEISNRLPWLQLISNITYHRNKLDFILHTGPVAPVAPFGDFSGAEVSFLIWVPLSEASALMSAHCNWSKFFFPRMHIINQRCMV